MTKEVRQFEIWTARLRFNLGSIQHSYRPVIVLQNDIGNLHSPNTIVCAVTTKLKKLNMPTHCLITDTQGREYGQALLEQVFTVEQCDLEQKLGTLNLNSVKDVKQALLASFGLVNTTLSK